MLTADEMIRVMEKAKELGLQKLELNDLKFEFVSQVQPHINHINLAVPDLKSAELMSPLSVFDELTDEEILYWSTPRYDEIQAEKEARKNKQEGTL